MPKRYWPPNRALGPTPGGKDSQVKVMAGGRVVFTVEGQAQ
jgi:hypothetical protein